MNEKELKLASQATATTSKLNKIHLRQLIIKYHMMKRQLTHFDKKYIGYTPNLRHNYLQQKFGTSSLHNIKNVLKMQTMTDNIYSNQFRKHTDNYNVNKRLNKRIKNIQGNTTYHKDNHHFSIPHWKIRYLKIHNIKKQKLRQLKTKIKLIRQKNVHSTYRDVNRHKVLNKSQSTNNIQKILDTPQQYQNRQYKNMNMKHTLYKKPTMSIKVHQPHTLQKGYQKPRHPERFQHRGFSI